MDTENIPQRTETIDKSPLDVVVGENGYLESSLNQGVLLWYEGEDDPIHLEEAVSRREVERFLAEKEYKEEVTPERVDIDIGDFVRTYLRRDDVSENDVYQVFDTEVGTYKNRRDDWDLEDDIENVSRL